MKSAGRSQRQAFESIYGDEPPERWSFHDTDEPFTRFLRDRRIQIGIKRAIRESEAELSSVLVSCGGVGGEGTYCANQGFAVTVTDFSLNALSFCRQRDPRLAVVVSDAEHLAFKDDSFDVVLVQDSLHHLRQPAVGLTEMLRVAKHVVILIEPHAGLVGNLLGQKWETENGAANYVFRWTGEMVREIAFSYLLDPKVRVLPMRLWDHALSMRKALGRLQPSLSVVAASGIYGFLDTCAPFMGNMMVAVVVKPSSTAEPA